jgi:hypothetical protein
MAEITSTFTSRFAGLGRARSLCLLVMLVVAMLLSLPKTHIPTHAKSKSNPISHSAPDKHNPARNDDLRLYRMITERMASGENYYTAVAAEHRANNYPLRPFVTVRLPTLVLISATLGTAAMYILLAMLAIATLLAWWRQLDGAFADSGRRASAVMLLVAGLILTTFPKLVVLHELWAGLLIALSLGMYRSERIWPSLLAAGVALAIRETALPYILLMGAFALYARRWKETIAWTGLVAGFAIALLFHAQAVTSVTNASDLASQGWNSFGGWPLANRALRMTSALRVFPDWLGALFVAPAIFGWLSWKSPVGLRVALYLAGFAFMLCIIGRAENFYWGLMVSPLLLVGFAFLPQAFDDLRETLRNQL